MPFRWDAKEHVAQGRYFIKWLIIASPLGAMIGAACALFLWALEQVTQTRQLLPSLLFFLPLAGLLIAGLYLKLGKSVEGGNNLIMDQIHEPGGGVPSRMAPLILVSTVITHLFGGSAGREGTAVQMGGSIASTFARLLRLNAHDVRIMLMAGIAGGFGAVFGTPLAGAVFAMEVLAVGRMSYEALIPCLIASIVGDQTCIALGIRHTPYQITSVFAAAQTPHLDPLLLGKVALAAVAFGLASVLFAELQHSLQHMFKSAIRWPLLRPVVGGAIVIGLVYLLGTRDYLGLGVTASDPQAVSIVSCFRPDGATDWSWWWKILFTAVTLGCGFKGGEVTPLFFIGASLGNVSARLLDATVYTDLFAGLGFIAVFAGATNTPLACTIMGIELFGSGAIVYMAVACYLAYLFSGHTGVYLSQRIAVPKTLSPQLVPDASLRLTREMSSTLTARLIDVFSTPEPVFEDLPETKGDNAMPARNKVVSKEIGQLRVYLTPKEKRNTAGYRQKLFGKALYQEIIDAAKRDGILNAVAHHTHYGYSGNGKVQSGNMSDIPNMSLNLCVELIAPREDLELFARNHVDLLSGKVLVYKHMEHWDIRRHDIRITEANLDELDADLLPEDPKIE
jgi:H+/Cl- antiporter ClcA/PII-like signaling protein